MQLRLTVNRGSNAGQELHLETGWLLFGRGPDASVQFTDPTVSAHHALIEAAPDGFYITDYRSFNGTYVNGQRVERARLSAGDVIELGAGGPQIYVEIDAVTTPHVAHETHELRDSVRSFGLYDPERDTGRESNTLRAGCAVSAGAVLSFFVGSMVLLDLGPLVAILSAVIAFVPAVLYLTAFLWLDRYDPEPFTPLAFAFAFGALFAVFVSSIVNSVFGLVAGDALTAIVSAPVIEEATKGLGVLMIVLLFRRDFDSVVDGIVYAGVVALGFATVENILYYGRSLTSGGAGALFATFILRGVFSPFSHVLFTAMTGAGFGIMRETHNQALKILAPMAGYVIAVFLHSMWNMAALFAGAGFFAFYIFIEMPMFIGTLAGIAWLLRRERRILQQTLGAEVARGLITPEQLEIVTSLARRGKWLAESFGHPGRLQARRRFLRTAAKLGLCHWHVARAAAAGTETQSFPLIAQLQAEVFALRGEVG